MSANTPSTERKPSGDDAPLAQLKDLCRKQVPVRDELLSLAEDPKTKWPKWRSVVKERFGIWLSADSQASRWRAWALKQVQAELKNDRWEMLEESLSKRFPTWSRDQIRDVGLVVFMEETLAQGDRSGFLEVVDRDRAERIGQTKAQHKERELAVAEMRLRMDTTEWAEAMLKKASELNNSNLSNADKIAAMRQALFADIEALAKSGKVQIPT